MNILVTGANGQLGREMQRLSAVSPNNYTFTDVAELNVTDAGAVRQAVAQTRAEVIVNCAAYTNVERAEEDEEAADRLNRGAAENLARAAEANGATLIHVSTDYVFDGTAHLPYTEDAPTAPLGVYGRTKLAGERAVAESGCKYLTFRTAWLYSEYGNNFLKTMLRLTAEKERLNVVFDQAGTPTYAGDLAMTIVSIVEGGYFAGNEGLYHFSNEGVASWYDFAAEIAAAAGHDKCRIRPCRTAEFPTKAARPAYSVLDKSKIKETFGLEIPHWRRRIHRLARRAAVRREIPRLSDRKPRPPDLRRQPREPAGRREPSELHVRQRRHLRLRCHAQPLRGVRHRRGDPSRGRKPRRPLDPRSVHFRADQRDGDADAVASRTGALERRMGRQTLPPHLDRRGLRGLAVRRDALHRADPLRPPLALLGVESLVGPFRTGVPRHVRIPGRGDELFEQLRALSVSRETDPAVYQ